MFKSKKKNKIYKIGETKAKEKRAELERKRMQWKEYGLTQIREAFKRRFGTEMKDVRFIGEKPDSQFSPVRITFKSEGLHFAAIHKPNYGLPSKTQFYFRKRGLPFTRYIPIWGPKDVYDILR